MYKDWGSYYQSPAILCLAFRLYRKMIGRKQGREEGKREGREGGRGAAEGDRQKKKGRWTEERKKRRKEG